LGGTIKPSMTFIFVSTFVISLLVLCAEPSLMFNLYSDGYTASVITFQWAEHSMTFKDGIKHSQFEIGEPISFKCDRPYVTGDLKRFNISIIFFLLFTYRIQIDVSMFLTFCHFCGVFFFNKIVFSSEWYWLQDYELMQDSKESEWNFHENCDIMTYKNWALI